MVLETLTWCVLPAIICLFVIVLTIRLSIKIKKLFSWILSLIILIAASLSFAILCTIYFTDSWPTFIPHIAIGFSIILLLIQFTLRKKRSIQAK